jgi:solute carrier family 25 citrate transporter 1
LSGTNQAANFTVYQYLKQNLTEWQPKYAEQLPSWQTAIVGFISGACGPLFNAPVDTIKTRIQKNPSTENGFTRVVKISRNIIQNEGYAAFYRGLTPRVLRVAPGQSITFMVYEKVYAWLVNLNANIKEEDLKRAPIGKGSND